MRRIVCALMGVLWMAGASYGGWWGKGDLPPVSTYTCARAMGPIEIDGKLDEFAWQAAEEVGPFWNIDEPLVIFPTRAKMVWDDRGLYFAFACLDRHVWATYRKKDEPLSGEEVVEVFIDPDGESRRYAELEVNPLNTMFDLIVTISEKKGWTGDLAWEMKGFRSAVQIYGTVSDPEDEDRGWTVEIFMPWAAFDFTSSETRIPPKEGDTWRLNLYRVEHTKEDRTENTAWSLTLRNGFHDPERFGIVTFSETPAQQSE